LDKYLNLEVYKFYNAIRNYLTKKPWNKEKIKLNFQKSTLLHGWDKNKEKDNYGVILRKWNNERNDYDYFLAILRKPYHNILEDLNSGFKR